MRVLAAILAVLLVGSGCKNNGVTGVEGTLRFDPDALVFDTVFADGDSRLREVNIVNEGRASVEVSWVGLATPFSADLPTRLPPGATTLTIRYTPTVAGRFSQLLDVKINGSKADPATLAVEATAREIPTCDDADPCLEAHFDKVSASCVSTPVADETPCDSDTLCLVNTRCIAGRCVGDARTCADDNKCTVDVCYPKTGCEFLPAPPCPGDGSCMEGVCDPQLGCGLKPREDGTACGSFTSSCTEVSVCIEGACELRDPPDGFVCREASPCNDEGRCQGNVCVQGSTQWGLQPSWTFDTLTAGDPDGGSLPPRLHDFVLEPSGAMSLSGFFDVPAVLRANTPNSLAAPLGASRRCILWNGRYVCADYPASPNGKVSALDLATGSNLWTFDVRSARPDFLEVASTIFLARLVVQDSDRLAAIFEAYPRNAPGDSSTQCRRYFLAVIDAAGQLVQAQQIVDPLFDTCNHPHPYGVAADSVGNLFISYSPTVSNQAPLVPADTTLIISFSRDGVFRWKRLNTGMRGGELAVARGLLYAEYTSVVLDATSGQPVFAIPNELGRAVISTDRLVPAPVQDGNTLRGYEAGINTLRWTYTLPGSELFWSDQLRLANWQTSKGPRVVALTWVKSLVDLHDPYSLLAIDVQDGATAFQCPVAVGDRTPPQLFEVANGTIAMMNGAMDPNGTGMPGCNKCDPPLAGSSGTFVSIPTPKLAPANQPWVGTFGGSGHDHRENN
ncbi:MAG: PQQ-binding-like beta-propeller repeat protein [Archangium sp.]|nr:PQQ-binding-like beta-propeller repeat protein [Archangium sp.]